MELGVVAAFATYLILLALIGVWAERRTKEYTDYMVASRKLQTLAVALSAEATDMSAWLTIGLPGQAYRRGLVALWASIGCALGTLLNWVGLGARLRILTGRFRAITIPDYLEARFNDTSRFLRIFSALLILLFMTAYVGAVAKGAAKGVMGAIGVDFFHGLVISYIIIVAYTVAGGFWAVAWTDVLQALLMVIALVILPIAGFISVGGIDKALTIIAKSNPAMISPVGGLAGAAAIALAITYFSWIVGYPGQPHIITRFIAAEDPRKLRRPGSLIGMFWVLISLWGAVGIGLAGHALLGPTLPDPEMVTPTLALKLLPSFLAGLVIAAIVAAAMSTMDSQLLVATSALIHDLYFKLRGVRLSRRKMLFWSRVVTIVIAAVSFVAGISGSPFVYWAVSVAWGGSAAVFAPILLLSVWWKRMTRVGAIAGMVVGAVGDLTCESLGIYPWGIPPYFIWFFINLLVSIVVSLFTKPPEGIEEVFSKVFTKAPIRTTSPIKALSEIEIVEKYVVSTLQTP